MISAKFFHHSHACHYLVHDASGQHGGELSGCHCQYTLVQLKRILSAPEPGGGVFSASLVSTFRLLHCWCQTTDLSAQHPLGAPGKLWQWYTNVPSDPDGRGCCGVSEGKLRCSTLCNSWEVQTRRKYSTQDATMAP